MRIAVDIDSTLHHYWDGFAAAARRRFGVSLPYEHQVTWGVPELRPEQVKAVIAETHSDESILAARPYPGAVEVIAGWKAAGHFVQIASHREERCETATRHWLESIGLPYDELHCSFDKVSHARELAIDVLIDDSPVNLSRAQDEGMLVATLCHPWNRDLCEEERILCAGDWYGLRDALAGVLGPTPAA